MIFGLREDGELPRRAVRLRTFGGCGRVEDRPAERHTRDVKLCTLAERTSWIRRLVIAREILARL